MSKKRIYPWLQFYPADHRADPTLRMCSLAARGLWVEMLCLMHEAEPYGCLVINKNPLTAKNLASLVGETVDEVESLLSELEQNGVFSRTRNDFIYSRRMVADFKKRKTAQENGKKGGNPSLCNKKEKTSWDKGKDKHRKGKQVKPQKPEARGHKTLASGQRIEEEWKKKICKRVGTAVYTSWIEPLIYENGSVICGSEFIRQRVEQEYGDLIEEIIDKGPLLYVVEADKNRERTA